MSNAYVPTVHPQRFLKRFVMSQTASSYQCSRRSEIISHVGEVFEPLQDTEDCCHIFITSLASSSNIGIKAFILRYRCSKVFCRLSLVLNQWDLSTTQCHTSY